MEKYKAALETMCKRCIDYEACRGTGCGRKKDLQELIEDIEVEKKVDHIFEAYAKELGKSTAAFAESVMEE